jgi:hypothetical protein
VSDPPVLWHLKVSYVEGELAGILHDRRVL